MGLDKILISENALKKRVDELAGEIAKALSGETFVAIGVLTGAVMFASDLLRSLHAHRFDPEVDFIGVKSYGDKLSSSGNAKITTEPCTEIEGRIVLLIDDIIDTGRTLQLLAKYFQQRNVKRLVTCILLDKPSRREVDVACDYVGFKIDDLFAVGYGLDAAGCYRSLPYIAAFD